MKHQKFCMPLSLHNPNCRPILHTHSIIIRSRLPTCKRIQVLLHAKEQGSLHSLLPRITIAEYLSTRLLPETKEHGKNVSRYEI